MSQVEARQQQAGLVLPEPPIPVAVYVPAVTALGVAYTVGQLPLVRGELAANGKVGEGPGLIAPVEAPRLAILGAPNAFGDVGSQVRSAVGVAVLPLDAPIEVELTVAHD